MAIVTTDDSNYKAIADVIRDTFNDWYGRLDDVTYLSKDMATAINTEIERLLTKCNEKLGSNYQVAKCANLPQAINEFGNSRYNEGVSRGLEDGGDLALAEFWNSYCNASKNDCDYMFAGQSWTAATFTPPAVTLNPKRAMYMFSRTAIVGDTVELFGRYGFSVDFSQCTYIDSLFNNASGITRLGVLDFSGANASANNVFINATALKTIDKLIVGENTKAYTNWFNGASALEDLTIEGVIDKNGFSVQWSPKLSKKSIISIISSLSDTATELTVTFSRTAVNKAFETAEGANDGVSSVDWESYCWGKPNWTIALA